VTYPEAATTLIARAVSIASGIASASLLSAACGSSAANVPAEAGAPEASLRDTGSPRDVGASAEASANVESGPPPVDDSGKPAAATPCEALQALPARKPTYYVDFAAGSDIADGKSKTTPFQHAPGDANAAGQAASTMLVPGDVVLLKGGVHYEGTITLTASGTKTSPIVLEGGPQEGWGSGMAIIDGQEMRALGVGVENASYVIVEGLEVTSFDKSQSSTGISVNGGTNDEIVGNVLKDIYYVTNPTPGSTAWEQQSGTGIAIQNSSGTNVYANSVRDCGNAGISISADAASVTGGTTSCNEVTNMNWGIVVALGDSTPGTHIEGLVITHNYIHDFDNYVVCDAWHRDGIFVFARPDDGTLTIDNLEIGDNYFEDTLSTDFGSTAWIYIEYVCRNFNVHHNILNASRSYFAIRVLGDGFQVAGNHVIANNVIANSNGQGSTGMHIMESSGAKIVNNVFYDDDVGYMIATDSMMGYSGDYNVFYNTTASDTNAIFLNAGPAESPGSGAGVEELSLSAAQAAGEEKHSYFKDPMWSSPFAAITSNPSGFKPAKGSVAIDDGTLLTYTEDYAGTAIPEGKGPDIGAYEQ
jgi:hypothetical protein